MKRFWTSAAQMAVVMPFAVALGVYTAQTANAWPAWIAVGFVIVLIAVTMKWRVPDH